MNNTLLKIQIILSYVVIATAAIIAVYGLGFMSEFYTLYMNGNGEMFTFFKDLQTVNTKLFTSGLTFLVLALFLQAFDLNKKIAGVFGVCYTLIITIINIVNGSNIIASSKGFKSAYNSIDFTSMKDYTPSAVAFDVLSSTWVIAIIVSVALAVVAVVNHLSNKKKGE